MIGWLLGKLFRVSTIGPALTRYYIVPRFKIHYIHSSDDGFHTHPWDAWSFILGWYDEERGNLAKQRRYFFNRVYAFTPHKVTIIRPVWTLFIHGPRINENWNYGESIRPWEGSDEERERLRSNRESGRD